jgi:D-3-phosphoglycerate dehydrogenase
MLKKLKFIARPGAGLENIDTQYCKLNQISVFRSPEGNRDAVAEHATGMVLMLINNLKRADIEVRQGSWRREANRGTELMGKTLALIGYGFMGKAFSERLSGFGVNVIAYDKYLSGFGSNIVKEVELDEVFETADFVSLHTPLSSETIGMVDYSFISKFKKPFVLINTARGKSVILKDLLMALKKGLVLGACLDVFEIESSSFENFNTKSSPDFLELSKMSNVILSPHIAGWTKESKFKMAKVVLQKIKTTFINK